MLDLSIIIVNYKTKDFLLDCLGTIYQGDVPLTFEVWVIDNGSADGSVEVIKERFKKAKLIANKENLGFARASNIGLQRSRGRYALVLNPDTKFSSSIFLQLIQFMDTHPDVGAVSPKLLNPDGTLERSFFYFPTLARQFFYLTHLTRLIPESVRRIFSPTISEDNKPVEVDWFVGPCMMLRRQALDEVGLFDENLFMYSEDLDICYRLKKRGWKIFCLPGVEVIHIGSPGDMLRCGKNRKEVCQQTLVYFFRKHYGRFSAVGLRLLQCLLD